MDDTLGNTYVDKDSYHEVIYTEWVVPTESLTSSDDWKTSGNNQVFSVREDGEFGEMIVKIKNTVELPATRNYRIWIEF